MIISKQISCFTLLTFLIFSLHSIAQDSQNQDLTNATFGKGLINRYAKDSTWYTKIAFRFQTQYEGISTTGEIGSTDPTYTDRFRVRRARIKGSGWATKSKKWAYKFEYDVHNGFVLDAVLKYNFAPGWQIWFGQTKLPGNMERIISSQKLQLVDRSLLNSRFTLDRDAGFQLHHSHSLKSNFVIVEKLAFSQGEGLNQTGASQGHSYTGKVELFPFGKFKSYISSDLRRNQSPKLMIGLVYDYNSKAERARGQGGDYLSETRNLETIFAEAHFKYKGISFMSEFVNRRCTDESPIVDGLFNLDGILIGANETFYTGQAINVQLGYLYSNMWEVAGRFTRVNPEEITFIPQQTHYTIGVSKYIVGHNLKIQGDMSLLQTEGDKNQVVFRLQTEFNF
tara:strand:- start:1680 stop:2867 length:1188 start_codon:yes stop_codon:yes gene_type:complete